MISIISALATFALLPVTPLVRELDCFSQNPESLIQSKGVSCACSSPHMAQVSGGIEYEVVKDLDTPEARFEEKLTEFEAAVIKAGGDLLDIVVDQGVSIRVNHSSGRFFELRFDENGYVSEMNDHSGSIRYHKEGLLMNGYDIKSPSQGFPDYAPMVTVTMDANGFITGGVLNQSGHTFSVPGAQTSPAANSELQQASGRSSSSFQITNEQKSRNYKSCVSACDATRNDASRRARADHKKCLGAADTALANCIALGVTASVSAGVATGVGITYGTAPVGGPLAIGAGVVSGLVVAVTGSAVTVVGCHIAAANSKNQCNHDLNTELDVIRNNHKSCVQQCKAAARNGGN
jgi:hypothetical protein